MERVSRWWWVLGLGLALACGGKSDEDDAEGDDGEDSSLPDDSGAGGSDSGQGTGGLPADPRPLTITVTGATSQSLTFDQVTCTHPLNSSNFRIFWRGTGHVFVLKAEVLGDYEGPGTYSSADTNTRASLQEEAGGSGFFFTVDPAAGDSVSFTMEAHDTDTAEAWGTFTVNGMTGPEGSIQIAPTTVPIWCPVVG
jgi:hypothetical protein